MATDYRGISENDAWVRNMVAKTGETPQTLGTRGASFIATQDLKQTKAATERNIASVKSKLTALNTYLNNPANNALTFFTIPWVEAEYVTTGVKVPKRISYAEAQKLRTQLNGELYDLNKTLRQIDAGLSSVNTTIIKKQTTVNAPTTSVATTTTPDNTLSADVIVNAPMPKVAYFRPIQSLLESRQDSALYSGNTPMNLSAAEQQWKTTIAGYGAGSKGMIQTWKPPANFSTAFDTGEAADITRSTASLQRYGFKFLYNPETISMSYGGVLGFDITTLTSGTTKTLPLAPGVFQSTISFNIPLNRIFDMSYLTTGGNIKGNTSVSEIYPYDVPANERALIYSRGTMYDFEYLLKSILGIEIPTQFRGTTADIGFLYGRPVELHLGTSLRYLVQISNISVDHLLFDSRMVPIFSNVSMTVNRIPDYSGEAIQNDTGGGTQIPAGSNPANPTIR